MLEATNNHDQPIRDYIVGMMLHGRWVSLMWIASRVMNAGYVPAPCPDNWLLSVLEPMVQDGTIKRDKYSLENARTGEIKVWTMYRLTNRARGL